MITNQQENVPWTIIKLDMEMKRLKKSRVTLGTSIAHNTLSWSMGHTEKETGQAETTLPADRNLGGVANLAPLFPSDGKGRGFSFSGQRTGPRRNYRVGA